MQLNKMEAKKKKKSSTIWQAFNLKAEKMIRVGFTTLWENRIKMKTTVNWKRPKKTMRPENLGPEV